MQCLPLIKLLSLSYKREAFIDVHFYVLGQLLYFKKQRIRIVSYDNYDYETPVKYNIYWLKCNSRLCSVVPSTTYGTYQICDLVIDGFPSQRDSVKELWYFYEPEKAAT